MDECDDLAEEPEDGAHPRGKLERERNIVTYDFLFVAAKGRRTKVQVRRDKGLCGVWREFRVTHNSGVAT